jgi:hypothetical protein
MNHTAWVSTEPQTFVLVDSSEIAEQEYPDTEAGAYFAARAVTRDVGLEHDLYRLCPET